MENVETIETAVNKIGVGKFHCFLIISLGIIQSCDSMEMLILTFLGPILTCNWKITIVESSILTTAVFIGIIVGNSLFGNFSDTYGRKPNLILTSSGLLYFGIMSALSPTISWMTLMRFFIGICIGGNSSALYSLLSEFTPVKHRGTFMVLLQLFWGLGSILITLICYYTLENYGWQSFLFLSTIPIIFVLITLYWVPESPRYLLLHNKLEKCLVIINKISRLNNGEVVTNLTLNPITTSSYKDLIHSNYLLTTVLLCFLWFISGLSYYSVVLIIPIINGIPHRCLQNLTTISHIPLSITNRTVDNSCCFQMDWNSYRDMFISTFGEIVFVPISIILINFIGRKRTLSVYILIITICLFLLNLCMDSISLNILLFILRGAVKCVYNINFIYAAEVYPTSVRSLGLGISSSFSRIGAIISPFLVNILLAKYSFIGGTTVLFLFNLIGLVITFILPYETKNRVLYQTADDHFSEIKPCYKSLD